MSQRDELQVVPEYQGLLREMGLDARSVFTHPKIKVWRSIAERENCVLDVPGGRLHIKRYRSAGGSAAQEIKGIYALVVEGIPTVKLIAWGPRVVITEDLAGYEAADKLVARGLVFDKIDDRIADLTAKLHGRGLHHRDLYLCHFFVNRQTLDVRLIDAARVKRLPKWFRQRWIVKDLAQLWYSMMQVKVSEAEARKLLNRYAEEMGVQSVDKLYRQIERKCAQIARHDARLQEKRPERNVSIPI
jgi:heptose I phosphotransferase